MRAFSPCLLLLSVLAAWGCEVTGSLGAHDPLPLGTGEGASHGRDASVVADLFAGDVVEATNEEPAHEEEPPADAELPPEEEKPAEGEPLPEPKGEKLPPEEKPVEPEPVVVEEPGICEQVTEDACRKCQQTSCCEPLVLCLDEVACDCRMECRSAADVETCVLERECGELTDAYERWVTCLEAECTEAC